MRFLVSGEDVLMQPLYNQLLTQPSLSSAALGLHTSQAIPFCATTLPKGVDVFVLSRYVSLRSKDVPKGPNDAPPDVFDPARYLVTDADTGKLKAIFPSTKLGGFLGFGHGVRSCPGRTYSEALSLAVLVATLHNFSWTLAPDHPEVKFILPSKLVFFEISIPIKKI
jgi:cytochrome P450